MSGGPAGSGGVARGSEPLAETAAADDAVTPQTSTGLAETVAPTAWEVGRRDASTQPLIEVSPRHYEFLGEQGRGGLGRVLRARDRRTGRVVALKEVLHGSERALQRFRREALVTANLQHPAIVPVYEVGQWPDGQPFYAMKLVEGTTLATAIRDAATTDERLALLPHVVQVADALAYAHARGWIHRDLKPGNVLVGAFGETVVIDWGLAKQIGDDDPSSDAAQALVAADDATLDGQILGTPVYMPPEQAGGERVDAGADVYAIGALLYHVLAGVPPYHEARSTAEVLAAVRAGPPQPLAELAPALPAELHTIVARAMAHDRDARYPSARELADDLARFRAGRLVAAHRYTAWELVRRWLGRHRAAATVAALAVVTLAVVGVIGYRANTRARRLAEAEGERARAARADAEARRRDAEDRVVALHTELGLHELRSGSPARALPYLADALRKAPDDPLVGFLVGRALATLTPLELAVPTDVTFALHFGGGRLAPSTTGRTPVVELERRRVLLELDVAGGMLSPDGRLLAGISGEAALVIHDVAAGAERARRAFAGDLADARWLAFDGAGRLVVLSSPGVVHVLQADLTTLRTARVPFPPTAIELSASGRVLAGGAGGELWSWHLDREGPGRRLPAIHHNRVNVLCVSHDGATWLSMGMTSTAVWRGDVLVTNVARGGLPAECELDAAGAVAVTSADHHGVERWDLTAAAPVPVLVRDSRQAPPNHSDAIALSPDGAMLAIGDARGELELRELPGGQVRTRFVGHDAPVATAAFAPDGARLATATAAGDVRVWRGAPTPEARAFDLGEYGAAGRFLDGAQAVVAGSAGARIVAVDTGELRVELRGQPEGVEVGHADVADGTIVTARGDGAGLWRADGALVANLDGGGGKVRRVGLSRDGRRVMTATEDGVVTLWRAGDGARERRLGAAAPLFAARLSPDGGRLLTTRRGAATVELWDGEHGEVVTRSTLDGEQAVDGVFSPDGALLAVPTATMRLPVLDGRTGEARFEVVHEAPVLAATWSADRALLYSTDLAGVLRVSQRDGTHLRSLETETGITAVAVHPGGHLLAIATQDAVTRVLDARTGRELARLAHRAYATALAFSPTGDHLAIAGVEDRVRLWAIAPYRGGADDLDARLRCAVPFRLDEAGGLVAAVVDPAACR